jgi:hypothetical protein
MAKIPDGLTRKGFRLKSCMNLSRPLSYLVSLIVLGLINLIDLIFGESLQFLNLLIL